jgi:hypothetical protein
LLGSGVAGGLRGERRLLLAARAWEAKVHNAAIAILLDGDGKIERLYEAKATPQMFAIDLGRAHRLYGRNR